MGFMSSIKAQKLSFMIHLHENLKLFRTFLINQTIPVRISQILKTMEKSSSESSISSAADGISRELKSLVNTDDLSSLKHLQHLILGRLQDSNAVLSHFNDFSENCFTELSHDFSNNTRLLNSIKSDLDYIFQKLRSMKAKISATYPDAVPDGSSIEILDRRPDLELPQ